MEVLKKPASHNFLWLFWSGLVIQWFVICFCVAWRPIQILDPENFDGPLGTSGSKKIGIHGWNPSDPGALRYPARPFLD